ncbi:hypothetical protein WJ970_11615 [Achromobacter xylosoxidans]
MLAGGSQPQAGLRQLDAALARDLGHRLFTVLALDWTRGLSVRHYSSAPLAYPPGGAKPIVPGGEFHARVIEAGEPRFCADADAIRAAFPDHELILSLGCESYRQCAGALERAHAGLAEPAARGGLVWRGHAARPARLRRDGGAAAAADPSGPIT